MKVPRPGRKWQGIRQKLAVQGSTSIRGGGDARGISLIGGEPLASDPFLLFRYVSDCPALPVKLIASVKAVRKNSLNFGKFLLGI